MREKERYLVFEWRRKKKEALNFGQVQELIAKEFIRQYGELGFALCGPRFRIFQFGENVGICIRLRREAKEIMCACMRTLKASFQLVHVAGSAAQATRAVKRKYPNTEEQLAWNK